MQQSHAVAIRGVTFTGSSGAGLVTYFPTGAGVTVKRMVIDQCAVRDCRQGIHFRGRVGFGSVTNSDFSGIQNYAIRFGQDWAAANWAGDVYIADNRVTDMWNPSTTSGTESNAIAAFANSAIITGNTIARIDNALQQDCEGIYTKTSQAVILGNTLIDAGRDEGSIVMKRVLVNPADTAGMGRTAIVANNLIRFTTIRDKSVGVSIQRDDIIVSDNVIDGYGVNGIRLVWRSAYHDVSIRGNKIVSGSAGAGTGGARAAAIALWAYGYNIDVTGNTISGAPYAGIVLLTNASGDTRYPTDEAPVGSAISISDNKVYGTGTRGIDVVLNAATPLSDVQINRNKIQGFTDYPIAIAVGAGSASNDWELAENIVRAHAKFFTIPSNLRVKGWGFESSGTDTVSASSSTLTRAHGLNPDLAAAGKISRGDFSITPLGNWGATTMFWVSGSIGQNNFVLSVSPQQGGSGFAFGWRASIDRVIP